MYNTITCKFYANHNIIIIIRILALLSLNMIMRLPVLIWDMIWILRRLELDRRRATLWHHAKRDNVDSRVILRHCVVSALWASSKNQFRAEVHEIAICALPFSYMPIACETDTV